jgi:mannonate dehydratase
MKIGVSLKPHMINDAHLSYFRQLGCDSVVAWVPLPAGDGVWSAVDLSLLKRKVNKHGLELSAIENVHPAHWDHVVLDEPGKDRQMENLLATIRNMGEVGIPCLAYNFSVLGVWGYHSERDNTEGRGGARIKKFDLDRIPAEEPPGNREFWFNSIQAPHLFDQDLARRPEEGLLPVVEVSAMWQRLAYFLYKVVPAAERAGVVLAAHPDDPPVPKLRKIARLLVSVASLKRLVEIIPSPSNRIAFCQGTITTMADSNVLEDIRYFASREKVAYVHFRSVQGRYPRWREVFIDEGEVDMLEALRVYKESGFDGLFIPDHTPYLELPAELWWETGMAYALGYMQAGRQTLRGDDDS